MKIAIIGSCGKKGAINKVHAMTYQKMLGTTAYNVKQLCRDISDTDIDKVTLVSGGAALSDHVAVDLFLSGTVKNLILYLPCEWDEIMCKYSTKTNEGRITNQLHSAFGAKIKKNTLRDMQMAIDKGATIVIGKGFYSRNADIAKNCDAVIAWTFDKKMTPGTKHTWNLCNLDDDLKIHLIIK